MKAIIIKNKPNKKYKQMKQTEKHFEYAALLSAKSSNRASLSIRPDSEMPVIAIGNKN